MALMPSLLPAVLKGIEYGLQAAFGPTLALGQWVDCSPMLVGAAWVLPGCRHAAWPMPLVPATQLYGLGCLLSLPVPDGWCPLGAPQGAMAANQATSPFVPINPNDPAALHHHPELCYSLAKALDATNPEGAASQLGAAGLSLAPTAAAAWLGAAYGSTAGTWNATKQGFDWCAAARG